MKVSKYNFVLFFFALTLNKDLFKLVEGEVGSRNLKQEIAGPGSQEMFSYGCVSLNQLSPHTSYCMRFFLFVLLFFVCLAFKLNVSCSRHYLLLCASKMPTRFPPVFKHSNNFICQILRFCVRVCMYLYINIKSPIKSEWNFRFFDVLV